MDNDERLSIVGPGSDIKADSLSFSFDLKVLQGCYSTWGGGLRGRDCDNKYDTLMITVHQLVGSLIIDRIAGWWQEWKCSNLNGLHIDTVYGLKRCEVCILSAMECC